MNIFFKKEIFMDKEENTKETRGRKSRVHVIHIWHQMMNSNTQERRAVLNRLHMQERGQGKERDH